MFTMNTFHLILNAFLIYTIVFSLVILITARLSFLGKSNKKMLQMFYVYAYCNAYPMITRPRWLVNMLQAGVLAIYVTLSYISAHAGWTFTSELWLALWVLTVISFISMHRALRKPRTLSLV